MRTASVMLVITVRMSQTPIRQTAMPMASVMSVTLRPAVPARPVHLLQAPVLPPARPLPVSLPSAETASWMRENNATMATREPKTDAARHASLRRDGRAQDNRARAHSRVPAAVPLTRPRVLRRAPALRNLQASQRVRLRQALKAAEGATVTDRGTGLRTSTTSSVAATVFRPRPSEVATTDN